ncbi:nuclear transport factor 2 [Chloropicon primus]|uniref:Nuclear transport factor 2 n=1 Tax=Chloropicon primus TaxID=1764295 RepID=A0A5B8MNF3_9CHLO|nr:nuclear transport factor 2 [Chloropicon primus]UPR00287.1 nuclear transport factor 2 [Chloropicon primus]|mmetsp:Transcript_7960/g.22792  ORF Transcript_7960/g.22792 Transcript_7960/m.22792 type:complete len:127 (+) Transcript_7960:84-464(+)|eukprot:QDZ21075.1 nuclear transport factor 2 [Chloropicon primus]
MTDFESVGKAFVGHYYKTFDAPGGRAQLGSLYQDTSMLTWEGQQMQGAQAIVQKLSSLPFQSCTHHVSTMDCQPSGQTGGIIVSVTGQLLVEGEQHPLKFSQVFQLMPSTPGNYFVLNDIFRLNYA